MWAKKQETMFSNAIQESTKTKPGHVGSNIFCRERIKNFTYFNK